MAENIIFAIFVLGISVSILIWIVRFFTTPNPLTKIFQNYLYFLKRTSIPKFRHNKPERKKEQKGVWTKMAEREVKYENFKLDFPDEENPYEY